MRDIEIAVDRALESALRRYVLGALDEPRRLEIEERLITDLVTCDRLEVIEQELTEEYLEGALSSVDAERYERHFLASAEHQRQLAFVRGLREMAARTAADRPAPSPPGLLTRVRELLQLEPLLVGAAGCALILLTGLAAWSWMSHRALMTELAAVRSDYVRELQRGAPPPPLAAASPAPTVRQEREQAGAPAASRLRESVPRGRPLWDIPTFALTGSLLRSEGALTRITYPEGAPALRFHLDTPNARYPSYGAVLYDGNADERYVITGLQPTSHDGRTVVTVVLPTDLLPAGDHQLEVIGVDASGSRESLRKYTVRVRVQ
jgi:hypothetical protein